MFTCLSYPQRRVPNDPNRVTEERVDRVFRGYFPERLFSPVGRGKTLRFGVRRQKESDAL